MRLGHIQGNLPAHIVKLIAEFNSGIDHSDFYFDRPLNYPPHITIAKGIDINKISEYQALLNNKHLIVEKVQQGTYIDHERNLGILWLEVQSHDLIELYHGLIKKFNLTNLDQYLPHISCAFLKQNSLDKYTDKLSWLGNIIKSFEISDYPYLSDKGTLRKKI